MSKRAWLLGFSVASLFSGILLDLGDVVIRPFDLSISLLVFLYIAEISRKSEYRLKINKLLITIVTFYAITLVMAIPSGNISYMIKEGLQKLEFVFLALISIRWLRRDNVRRDFLRSLFVFIIIFCIWVLLWHILHGYYTRYKALGAGALVFGIAAIFVYSNILSIDSKKLVLSSLLTSLIVLTVLSGERKSWVGLLVGIIIMSIVVKWESVQARSKKYVSTFSRNIYVYIFFAGVVSILSLWFLYGESKYVAKQVDSFSEIPTAVINVDKSSYSQLKSNVPRAFLLKITVSSLKEKPFLGQGSGEFKKYHGNNIAVSSGRMGSHGVPFRVAVENGMVGLLAFAAIYILYYVKAKEVNYRNLRGNALLIYLLSVGLMSYGLVINLTKGGIEAYNDFFIVFPSALLLAIDRCR